MNVQTALYLMHPGSNERRTLISGTVLQVARRSFAATFDNSDVELVVGQILTVYFREGRQFRKQEVKVAGIKRGTDRGVRLKLSPTGEPTAGEIRESERYSTVFEGMTATFGETRDCLLVDVSAKGLALVAGTELEVGQSVRFEMWVKEVCYRGSCTVRSVTAMPRDQWRYGVSCDDDVDNDNLRNSLKRLWLTLQMKQLRSTST